MQGIILLYIIIFLCDFSGLYEVSVGEKLMQTYEGEGSFGELALLYNTPRAATITAISDGQLWALVRTVTNLKHLWYRSQWSSV